MNTFFALAIGAICGATTRWILGNYLNPLFPTLPFGTLAANLLGAFLIGLLIALFEKFPFVPPPLRVGTITGFLGSLTTFSTFSAEAVHLLSTQNWSWAGLLLFVHVFGSLAMTYVGMLTIKLLIGV